VPEEEGTEKSKRPDSTGQDEQDEDELRPLRKSRKTTARMNPKRKVSMDDTADQELGEKQECPTRTPPDGAPRPAAGIGCGPEYLVYATDHDEVIGARKIWPNAELERLRANNSTTAFEPFEGRGGADWNKLQRRLQAQQNRQWEFGSEEATLETPGRLAARGANPTSHCHFRSNRTPIPAIPA